MIFDAYAVLALLKGEPAAVDVQRLLEAGQAPALTAVGVAEVLDHLVRLEGSTEEDAVLDLAQLGLAEAIPVDVGLATRAGLLRARHYHRSTRAVSLADCVAAEVARAEGSPLVTADPHLLELCRDEGIDAVVLPDSSGRTWS
ncbi:MAG: PIN domain-containing protein [Acidimicrobiales bacterium]